jgi:uncharacterized membrane protein
MNFIRVFFTRELAMVTVTLGCATLMAVLMVAARVVYTRELLYAFLVWNLVLAWFPYVLAVSTAHRIQKLNRAGWTCAVLAVGWLLFFPNAPYLLTDLVHLYRSSPNLFWVDLMLILICASIGIVLGLASLRIMHALVARRLGWFTGWTFVAMVAGLAAFGVHLGRFLRLNSWDAAFAPVTLVREGAATVFGMLAHPHQAVFPALFACFLFLAYAMFHALSRMPHLITVGSDAAAQRHCESSAGVSPASPGSQDGCAKFRQARIRDLQ